MSFKTYILLLVEDFIQLFYGRFSKPESLSHDDYDAIHTVHQQLHRRLENPSGSTKSEAADREVLLHTQNIRLYTKR